jgi:hypothetical protein
MPRREDAVAAEPIFGAGRLPIDTSLARATVDATVKLLGQLSDGRRSEPAWVEARDAARALHLEVAGAEFDARLPARPARSGPVEPAASSTREA